MIRYELNNLMQLREATGNLDEFLKKSGVTANVAFDARLIVNELASNVIKHARSKAWVEVEITGAQLQLTVYSENGSLPPNTSRCPECVSESGRGLFLVDKLSLERSVTKDGGVRVVIKL